MQIDITKLLNHSITTLNIKREVQIPTNLLENSLIEDLKNIILEAKITLNEDNDILIIGTLSGTMILRDDITLEPVEYNFNTEIEEILNKNQNILEIIDILWQNILVEIPSKVRSTNEDIELSGNGWRVISEERFNEERNKKNNPFSNLDKLINAKEER